MLALFLRSGRLEPRTALEGCGRMALQASWVATLCTRVSGLGSTQRCATARVERFTYQISQGVTLRLVFLQVRETLSGADKGDASLAQKIAAGAFTGALGASLANPLDVVRGTPEVYESLSCAMETRLHYVARSTFSARGVRRSKEERWFSLFGHGRALAAHCTALRRRLQSA